ncbi:hypothetical protein ACFL10_01490 [Patescibacteria group bacterium]
MGEKQTPGHDEESNLTLKFEELIGAIKPAILGLDVSQAMPRIKQAIRAYFLAIGKSMVDIKGNESVSDWQNLEIISDFPELHEIFELADNTIAIAAKEDTIVVYQFIGKNRWVHLITAQSKLKDVKDSKSPSEVTNEFLAKLLRNQDSMEVVSNSLETGEVSDTDLKRLEPIVRKLVNRTEKLSELFRNYELMNQIASRVEAGEVDFMLTDRLFLILERLTGNPHYQESQKEPDTELVPYFSKLKEIQVRLVREPLDTLEGLLAAIMVEFKNTNLKLPSDKRKQAFEAEDLQYFRCNPENSVDVNIGDNKCTIQLLEDRIVIFMNLHGGDIMLPVAY